VLDQGDAQRPWWATQAVDEGLGLPGRGVGRAKVGSAPAVISSSAALSRTDTVIAWAVLMPAQPSPVSGPLGMRPRLGLRPNTPQQDAGTRSEPPPSLPWAKGTTRAATSAAAPPLEPPTLRAVSQGLRVAPKRVDSVV